MAQWGVEWLVKVEGGTRSVPAFTFLREQPSAVRNQLLAIVDAVRTVGPDRWRDPQTHRPMKGDIDDLHEARDKHDKTLYRLFLLWQRTEQRVVILDGREKPDQTALSNSEYQLVRDLADTVKQHPPPFAVADDFARELLAEDGD